MFRVSLFLGFEESPVLPRSSELADRVRWIHDLVGFATILQRSKVKLVGIIGQDHSASYFVTSGLMLRLGFMREFSGSQGFCNLLSSQDICHNSCNEKLGARVLKACK